MRRALAFLVALVGCAPPPPAVCAPPRPLAADARAVVKLELAGGDKGEQGRAERIRAEIEGVVQSPAFECLVTHFDQEHPFGQRGTEATLDICGGAETFPAPSALRGYRESRCTDAAPFRNDEAWRIFRASPQCDGTTNTLSLHVKLGTVAGFGATEPPGPDAVTITNEFWFGKSPNYVVAGHWIHEHTHRLGFCDTGAEQYSTTMIPFVYGFAGCLVAARAELGGKLSDHRAACEPLLGPAFKP